MGKQVTSNISLNRVEGDLEIQVTLTDGVVTDARSSGTLFRGFERILVGRGAMDGLVITPRICGICSITHLTAAAKALDQVTGVAPPANAVRLRNAALLAETIQSDVRQSLLMYMVDLPHVSHARFPWHALATQRYLSLRGERCVEAVRETRGLLEIIAIMGGQWPHTSFMVPGGVVYAPPKANLRMAIHLLDTFQRWYEARVLGCSVERWLAIDSAAALQTWLDEDRNHADSDTGFLVTASRDLGLDRLGVGHGRFLSFGSLEIPDGSSVRGSHGLAVAAGVAETGCVHPFDPTKVEEHTKCAWYADHPLGRHPFKGDTNPMPSGEEGEKYSWCKAPRYDGLPAETGPLAERLVANDPLFRELVWSSGPNALARQLARITRPIHAFAPLRSWLEELVRHHGEPVYLPLPTIQDGEGVGLLQAARGALGHWVRVKEGRIAHYQIIAPTTWNGSPRDNQGVRGPWEEALIGVPVADAADPVLAGMVIRSFDPCLVCAIHVVGGRPMRLLA
ncbi:MAG: nickel-dependent hydrogenase large subunit [Magnetococcus sp. DMHC-1]|nr:nickel-dependent hydrogenase large subunit [Magnetococcales bacterium]